MFDRAAFGTLTQPRGDVTPSSLSSSALPTAREGAEGGCKCADEVKYFQPKDSAVKCELSTDGVANASSIATTVSETSAETIRGEGSTPESPVTEDTKSSNYKSVPKEGDSPHEGKLVRPSPPPSAKSADYLRLAGCVRAAVEKSRRGYLPGMVEAQQEPRQFPVPRSNVEIELTDALREVIENVLDRPGIIAPNASSISLDVILKEIQLFKQQGAGKTSGLPDPIQVVQNCPIIKRRKVMAEVFLDSLTPSEQLRLRSSERKYQRNFSGTSAFETLRYSHADGEREVPDSLAIELEHSFAMSTSLLMGLFLSFFVGFNLPKVWGVANQTAQALCGLVMCILCLAVEVGLILVRYAKLSEIRGYRHKKHLKRVEENREEFGTAAAAPASARESHA